MEIMNGVPEGKGFCPSCHTLAWLTAPRMETLAGEELLFPNRDGQHRGNLRTACFLCYITCDSERRQVAVKGGLLWFLITGDDGLGQPAINQHLWGVIRQHSKRSRLVARNSLLEKLALNEATREAKLPQDIFSPEEIAVCESLFRSRMGSQAYQNLTHAQRNALYSTWGTDHLLQEYEPTWKGRERYFLTPRGVEYIAAAEAELDALEEDIP